MRPLLNKDFRRLRWLLRQEPSKQIRSSSTDSTRSFLPWLIFLIDYVAREVVTLTKGGVAPMILAKFKRVMRTGKISMAHAISVLCFVSRMRLRDRGGANSIPLNYQMCRALYEFFNTATYCWPVSVQHRSPSHSFALSADPLARVEQEETSKHGTLS